MPLIKKVPNEAALHVTASVGRLMDTLDVTLWRTLTMLVRCASPLPASPARPMAIVMLLQPLQLLQLQVPHQIMQQNQEWLAIGLHDIICSDVVKVIIPPS